MATTPIQASTFAPLFSSSFLSSPSSAASSSQNTVSGTIVNSSSSIQSKTVPLINSLNQAGSVKLDGSNFMLWHNLMSSVLRGHRLEGFVNGKNPPPVEYVEGIVNPDFMDWLATDQIIYSWLLRSMTSDVATQVLHCRTAAEIWKTINDLACSNSRARITMLKNEFQRTWKGTQKMEEYLNKMKSIYDDMALAGFPIPEQDLIMQTLAGLDGDYTPIMVHLSD